MIPVKTPLETGAAAPAAGHRTRQEAREWLRQNGVNVAQWARDHGLKPMTVHQVLLGNSKGERGQAHDVAVLLGMKPGVVGGVGVPQGPQAGPADRRRRAACPSAAAQGAQA